ncbi:MAG TPA: DNA polymerase III subunit delta [Dehalococcoidia bacterium]|nr:DNA polymerase III subunit delta [Dehalococcoidia bacterium]
MIHLIYGKDRYRVLHALRELRATLAQSDDMIETNTTVLDGASVTPAELLAHAQAVPFLASSRLVIVEGLLGHLGGAKRGRRSKKAAADDPLAPWQAVADQLADPSQVPETTTLIFVEGALASNAALSIFAPIARVLQRDALEPAELSAWIAGAAEARGLKLSPRTSASIAQLTGGDLWTIENELDKLAAFAGQQSVDEAMIAAVVSSAQEARLWDLTDAIVAGDERKALGAMSALLDEGQAATLLLFMLVRQYRQLAVIKDLRERRASEAEMLREVSNSRGRLNAITAKAARYGWPQIRAAYAALLDADLSVKRGLRDDEAALQLAVHELTALARSTTGRSGDAYARRAGSSSG